MRGGRGRPKARMALFCACAVAAFTLFTGVAFAADDPSISTELTAGTFVGILNGQGFTLNANEAGGGTAFSGFSIPDTRGTGVGWYVTMVATQFENATVAGKDIALDSLTMTELAVAKADEGSSEVPGTLHAAATIDTGGAGVVMAECDAHGQGMGTYDFTAAGSVPWKLAITADEYAGTYYSTVATTVATVAL